MFPTKNLLDFPNYSINTIGEIKSRPRLGTKGGNLGPRFDSDGYLWN